MSKHLTRLWRWYLKLWPALHDHDTVPDVAAKAAGVVALGVLLGWWLLTYAAGW